MPKFVLRVIAIVRHVLKTFQQGDLGGIAQQTAYNILFATGPLLITLTALAGLVTRQINAGVERPAEPVVTWVYDRLPSEAADFFQQPLERALSLNPSFLISIGGVLALWASKGAMLALMKGLNASYRVSERRNFIVVQCVAIGLTLATGLLVGVSSVLFVLGTSLGDTIADAVGLGNTWSRVSVVARWPVFAIALVLAVALLHRFAPCSRAPFRSFLPGAVFTVVAVVVSIFALQIFLNRFSSYNEIYGVFGSVLVVILWLYILAMVIFLGGAINLAIRKAGSGTNTSQLGLDAASAP